MASPTSRSAAPSPYISAVSMSVIPHATPVRSASISLARRAGSLPIYHVPCPMAGMRVPSDSVMVRFVIGGSFRQMENAYGTVSSFKAASMR